MNIQTYKDAVVTILARPDTPGTLPKAACKLTMSKQITIDGTLTSRALRFLCDAEHHSVLEHESVTFALEGVSRSFLAQITRHRTGKFTSASQHYADYRDMPMVIHPDTTDEQKQAYYDSFMDSLESYRYLVGIGVPVWEARQVLPNASATNLIWTVDMNNLRKFLRARLCNRNVDEMRIVAGKIWECVQEVWPDFAIECYPPCVFDKCTQGRMNCGKRYERI